MPYVFVTITVTYCTGEDGMWTLRLITINTWMDGWMDGWVGGWVGR